MDNNNMDIEKMLKMIVAQSENASIQAEQFKKQVIATYEIYKEIQESKNEVLKVKGEIEVFKGEMDDFKGKMQNLENNITLSISESATMSDLVRKKAINFSDYLNDIGFFPNAKDFGDIVKRVMISIRAMLKSKFKSHRWYTIKHTDFEEAMLYLENLRVNDFLKYRSRKIVVRNKNSYNKAN